MTMHITRCAVLLMGSVLSFLLAGCAGAPASMTPVLGTPAPGATAVAMPTLTPIPGIKATLTALPKQPPLSADQARPYEELRAAIERCNAYNENRKLGILSQIGYVLQPATAPSDLVLLYGDEWRARLIYGSAYLSALEWKLAGRDRSSCLYPIGVSFNALLRELHQSTFPEFE
jgi:hypothetical protein